MTNDPGPIVPPPRDGYRRRFSEADKRRIVEEAVQPGASLSAVARRCGIAARVLFRWKQELTAAPVFVAVQITDAPAPFDAASSEEGRAHGVADLSDLGTGYFADSWRDAPIQSSTWYERTIFPFRIVCTSIDMIRKLLPP